MRSFGSSGTADAGGSITWLANRPPPSTMTAIPSGTIRVTVPKKLKMSISTSGPASRASRRSRSIVPKIERNEDRCGQLPRTSASEMGAHGAEARPGGAPTIT